MSRKRELDTVFISEKWKIIESTIDCIFRKELSRNSFQSVYYSVFQLCQARHGNYIFENLEEVLRRQATECLKRLVVPKPGGYLDCCTEEWYGFHEALCRVSDVLLYFNKNYVPSSHRQTVCELGEHLFSCVVLGDAVVASLIANAVAEAVDSTSTWSSLKTLGKEMLRIERGFFYEPYVEAPYTSMAVKNYTGEGREKLQSLSVSEYLDWVQRALDEERQKTEMLLGVSSVPRVEMALSVVLVRDVRDALLHGKTGARSILEAWDMPSLKRVVDVFSRVGEISPLLEVCTATVKTLADSIVKDDAFPMPISAVDEVFDLREKLLALVSLFSGTSELESSPMYHALCTAINNSVHFLETLSIYYDYHIRQVRRPDLEKLCYIVITLFRMLRDKDVFEISFRSHLAARLIHARPEVIEAERVFIQLLKQECGGGSSNRLERMVADVQSGSEMHSKMVREMAQMGVVLPIHFHAVILTGGLWPQYPNVELSVPHAMAECMRMLQEFHTSRHCGRRLAFQMGLGTVVYELQMPGRVYSITAPTPFVTSIDALNADRDVTVEGIMAGSTMSRAEVEAQISALERVGLVVRSSSAYCFNTKFYSERRRIKLISGIRKPIREGDSCTGSREVVGPARSISIDAVIVSTMKVHKSMDHDALCQSVAHSLRHLFVPTPGDMKARIESLIGKGYLARGHRYSTYEYPE